MGGGLLQLVAYGAQDAYLSGNPQITFWRGLYKRHTNFAMEPFRVNLTGQADWGVKHSAILPRHADLISNAYLEVELDPAGTLLTTNSSGGALLFNLIEYVELDIGGQVIDRQYGEFMYLWAGLTSTATQIAKLNSLGEGVGLPSDPVYGFGGRPKAKKLNYIPLSFWFGRNPGAALPLIALQYHEVKINILWNKDNQIYQSSTNGSIVANPPRQANLLIDYVYLDVEERRRMAQESHEYLIEQTQFNEDKGITSANVRLDLTFNHPVKELIWVTQRSAKRDCRLARAETGQVTPFSYDAIISDCALQINGQDRVPLLPRQYYERVQPYQHHSGSYLAGLHCYSFALRPEEHQPSGTCNFSRIDTATLVFNVDGDTAIGNADNQNYNIRTYAVNYNVLRVMSGMAGLAYSN